MGKNNVSYRCGGSLVTAKHVVTAKHCFIDEMGTVFFTSGYVLLGTNNIDIEDSLTQHINIDKVYLNISKKKNINNYSKYKIIMYVDNEHMVDIALVVLVRPAELNDNVRPICLPINIETSKGYIGSNAFVAGWGKTNFNESVSNVMKEIQIPVVANSECQKIYSNIIDYGVLCAGGGGKDICFGDSGGPIMTAILINGREYYYQIGLVIFTRDCSGVPFASTYMPFVLDWIKRYIDANQ